MQVVNIGVKSRGAPFRGFLFLPLLLRVENYKKWGLKFCVRDFIFKAAGSRNVRNL